ncbi:hypothetical protein K504DRAFT_506521 [Pleomassaria siparia CBS 279.74]|uniref:Uncharacterized protein n=1 Tax=Pleomassaria siparia CBS 279.74 TaxID=1314801 RepID=A0A6G1JWQ9_9PLEO|nr:hypothetical protein K504DRAFT_506521 [Pleomassaria siparia CBS 279.74]
MHFFHLTTAVLLNVAMGAAVVEQGEQLEHFLAPLEIIGPPGSPIPPPNTPCKKICTCTEGNQPPEGRMYCGFCWGVDSESGTLYGEDVVKCLQHDCCNYGPLDGRCSNVGDPYQDQDRFKNVFCPGGTRKREVKVGAHTTSRGMPEFPTPSSSFTPPRPYHTGATVVVEGR